MTGVIISVLFLYLFMSQSKIHKDIKLLKKIVLMLKEQINE